MAACKVFESKPFKHDGNISIPFRSKDYSEYDWFCGCYLGHGDRDSKTDFFYGCNGVPVDLVRYPYCSMEK